MTNPFFTNTIDLIALNKARASDVEDNFSAVELGFDLVNDQVLLRGSIAGQTWTGAHNFPTPTSPAQAATKAYTDASTASVGAAVAWVSGTTYAAGFLVYSPINFASYRRKVSGDGVTDPSLDSTNWAALLPFGLGGAAITGSVTLLVSSDAAMTVTPASAGLYATLPDATIGTKAATLFSLYNAGIFDYGVKNSAGTQLGWVRPNTGARIGLSDSSTAAGVWTSSGLEKTAITAAYSNATLANTSVTLLRVAIDADRTCFVFGGTDCTAIIYNALTQTWGTPTTVRASVASGRFSAVLSAANQVMVVSCNATTGFEAVTLTIAANTITVNTGTKASVTLAGNSAQMGQIVAVSTSWVVSYGRATTTSALRAITVSGTTPTIGAEVTLGSGNTNPAALYVSGSIVRSLCVDASTVYCRPYTVSGSTLTIGTQITGAVTAGSMRSFLNGNGNIVVQCLNTTHFAHIFKLTGTVEAVSSISLGSSAATVGNSDCIAVTASKTLVISDLTSTTCFVNILTDTAGVASAGTQISIATPAILTRQAVAVSGNAVRVGLTTTPAHLQITLDASGASPILTSSVQTPHAGGTVSARFTQSSDLNVRSPTSLFVGAVLNAVANAGTGVFDLRVPSGVVQRMTPLNGFGLILVGEAENESWAMVNYSATTGVLIQRVEAAA